MTVRMPLTSLNIYYATIIYFINIINFTWEKTYFLDTYLRYLMYIPNIRNSVQWEHIAISYYLLCLCCVDNFISFQTDSVTPKV